MKPRQFFYVLIGAMALLVGGAGYGYYAAVTRVDAAKAELAGALADEAAADQQLSDLQALKLQYDRDIVPILPRINDALPRTKNQTEILAQLQAVAAASGLQLTGTTLPSAGGLPTNTSQTTKAGTVLALPITFQLQGSYDRLQAFLTRTENLSRFTNVTNLAVSRAEKGGTVTYSMTVNAYIKP